MEYHPSISLARASSNRAGPSNALVQYEGDAPRLCSGWMRKAAGGEWPKARERYSAIAIRNLKAIAAMKLVSVVLPAGQPVFPRCYGSKLPMTVAAIHTDGFARVCQGHV